MSTITNKPSFLILEPSNYSNYIKKCNDASRIFCWLENRTSKFGEMKKTCAEKQSRSVRSILQLQHGINVMKRMEWKLGFPTLVKESLPPDPPPYPPTSKAPTHLPTPAFLAYTHPPQPIRLILTPTRKSTRLTLEVN